MITIGAFNKALKISAMCFTLAGREPSFPTGLTTMATASTSTTQEIFYAEVWYNGNQRKVGSIKTFSTLTKLKPYLDKINIADIYH